MRQSKQLFVAVVALFIVLGLSGCDKQEQPDFSGYKKIADLATIDCTFHNVAEIYNDGTDIILASMWATRRHGLNTTAALSLALTFRRCELRGLTQATW